MRLAIYPFEDHSPLIIDSNRVVILQVALELLKPVRRRNSQIRKPARSIESLELTFDGSGKILKLAHPLVSE